MMIFILHIKEHINEDKIEKLIASSFSLKRSEVASLDSDSDNILIRYYIIKGNSLTEFNYRIVINVTEDLCLKNKVYNSLYLAIPLAKLINDEVVIHDHSMDPTRWILVNSSEQIFAADELLFENYENTFVINRKQMSQVIKEEAFNVLPSKGYVESHEKDRPIYYNTSTKWDQMLMSHY